MMAMRVMNLIEYLSLLLDERSPGLKPTVILDALRGPFGFAQGRPLKRRSSTLPHALLLHAFLSLRDGRIFLHKAGQVLYVFDWGFGQDAVAKIEDVAGASGGEAKNVFGARL